MALTLNDSVAIYLTFRVYRPLEGRQISSPRRATHIKENSADILRRKTVGNAHRHPPWRYSLTETAAKSIWGHEGVCEEAILKAESQMWSYSK